MRFKKLHTSELNRHSLESYKSVPKIPLILLADNIRSGHNVGSLFRIADAFALEGIVLSGFTVRPPHPEIQKTAIGSTESVPWIYENNASEYLIKQKSLGCKIIALEQVIGSIPLQNFKAEADQKFVLVLGNEVNGVSDEILDLADQCIEIPQSGTKHSLNVSVAAGVVCWQFYQMLR